MGTFAYSGIDSIRLLVHCLTRKLVLVAGTSLVTSVDCCVLFHFVDWITNISIRLTVAVNAASPEDSIGIFGLKIGWLIVELSFVEIRFSHCRSVFSRFSVGGISLFLVSTR